MGTRGLIGYYKKKVTKAAYNHYDSYPRGMGNEIKNYVSTTAVSRINADFEGIRFVDESTEVTPEIIIQVFNFWYGDVENKEFLSRNNACGNAMEMYDLLTCSHTNIRQIAYCGMMPDNISFIKDSLFCEWAYIINLDKNLLEVYRGFQSKKPKKNRYAFTKEEIAEVKAKPGYDTVDLQGKRRHVKNQYYNCDLIAQIPFEQVENFDMDLFEDIVSYAEDVSDGHVGEIVPSEAFGTGMIKSVYIPATLSLFGYVTTEFEFANVPWYDHSDEVSFTYSNPATGESETVNPEKFFPEPKPIQSYPSNGYGRSASAYT